MTALATEGSTADEMVKLAREQVDAFNKGDWERCRQCSPQIPLRRARNPAEVEGPEEIVELFKGWKTAFPDAIGTVTSAFGSGNTAALEVTWKGTHTGPLVTAEGTIPRPASVTRRRLRSSSPSRAPRSRRAASTSTP